MKKRQIPYSHFSNFVLRTPLLPLDYFEKLTSQEQISDDSIKEAFNNPVINEAIFLASPSLHLEAQKWCSEQSANDRLKFSLLKYISRMSSRCTPFGLFAGCALGEIAESTSIVLQNPDKNKRHTRLDMNYLVALSQDLVKVESIRKQLFFYPNSSHYVYGDQLRYVEYTYVNSRRQHHIVAVNYSDYLERVLHKARDGAKLADLSNLLVDDEISIEEATAFIDELVVGQLLISELEPSVSGPEFVKQLLKVLHRLERSEKYTHILEEVDRRIKSIDGKIGNSIGSYIELSEYLKQLETDFELKFLFQTDMQLSTTANTLDLSMLETVKKGLTLLNNITPKLKETPESKFKDAFYERYESRKVSLAKALDIEIGVGYKQNQGSGDVNPLIDDLILPANSTKEPWLEIELNSFHNLINKKVIKSYQNQEYCIKLTDEDLKDFIQGWDDLPDTLSAMIEVVLIDGDLKIKFSGASGSSAANLLGRFCHGDQKLREFTQSITDTEAQMNPNKILAEIAHLPESRVGNILMRPEFRKYEIPYLAQSIVPRGRQLWLDDLTIAVEPNNRIILQSESQNKEVIPRLTNAHNYSLNSLPIYNFLADLQTQGLRGGVYFSLGPLVQNYTFIPRVEYENIILQRATWNFNKKHIEKLIENQLDTSRLKKAISSFLKEYKLPRLVVLTERDNELLINFDNLTSIGMFLDTVKNKDRFTIAEFLFDTNSLVEGPDGNYAHQIVLSFYNKEKLNNQSQKR